MVIRLKLYHLLILAIFLIIVAFLKTTYIPHTTQARLTPLPEPIPTLPATPAPDDEHNDVPLEMGEYYFFWSPPLEYSTGNP